MKKTLYIFIFLSIFAFVIVPTTHADWWDRPDTRPTQPSVDRLLPTATPDPGSQPTQGPTNQPSQPTVTPIAGGGVELTPTTITSASGQGGPIASANSDDPCAPGKSFTGPYCGWSPGVGGTSSGGGSSQSKVQLVKANPKVKGLSKTSSGDVTSSDIILLTGILCLLLYVKSKTEQRKAL